MSGHEKFYIPHDDLVALEAAMASLETAIGTLETSMLTFSNALIDHTTTDYVTSAHTTEAEAELAELRDLIISADDDVFIRSINAFIWHATGNPLLKYNADLLLYAHAEDESNFIHEFVFGDIGRAFPYGVSVWRYARMWAIPNIIIPAGSKYQLYADVGNIRIGTSINIVTTYAKGV